MTSKPFDPRTAPTMTPEFAERFRGPSMEDLELKALKNHLVRFHLDMWKRGGGFRSLEQMLISLACHLAAENNAMQERAVMHLERQPFGPSPLAGNYEKWAASKRVSASAEIKDPHGDTYGLPPEYVSTGTSPANYANRVQIERARYATWTGEAGNNDAADLRNWKDGRPPQAGDTHLVTPPPPASFFDPELAAAVKRIEEAPGEVVVMNAEDQ